MPAHNDHDEGELERLLRQEVAEPADEWAAVRVRFGTKAMVEGLVDIAYEDHDTPLGRVRLNATSVGIVRTVLPAEDLESVMEDLARRSSARILRAGTATIHEARRELDEYFAGQRRGFEVPLDWSLTTTFRREVLRATAAIPYGRTSSYRDVATAAGSPKAVRAAGTALATNPLPILIPCHRVLRTDGNLGEYLGGQAAKAQLLAIENPA